ncbi:MAG: rod shape-determining protein MreD [Gemmobacter sp.]
MADALKGTVWGWRALFAAVVVGLIYLRLLPLGHQAGAWPAPDFVLCLTCALVLRRPEFVPALLIAAMVLIEDLLLMRPPGLWAALMLMGTEFLRRRAQFSREIAFVTEWIMVAVVMCAMLLGYRLALALVMLPQVAFGHALAQIAGSIAAYPLVVGVLRLGLGLRKPATGELDAMGRRL